MEEEIEMENLNKMTRDELRVQLKKSGIRGYGRMSKSEMIAAMYQTKSDWMNLRARRFLPQFSNKIGRQTSMAWTSGSDHPGEGYLVTGDSRFHEKALRRAKRHFSGKEITHRVAEKSDTVISFRFDRFGGSPKTVTVKKLS